MFDLDHFIDDCRRARAEDDDHRAVCEVLCDTEETLWSFADSDLVLDRVHR